MLLQLLNSPAVDRLKRLIDIRYGKKIEIRSMMQVSGLASLDQEHEVRFGDLHVPIRVEDHYFGTAIVQSVTDLSVDDHVTITELVKLILEPEFFNWYLENMAANAKVDRNHARNQGQVLSIFNHIESSIESEDLKSFNAGVICLQAHNPASLPRMFHDIHELSNRWAFLQYSDVQSQINCADDIRLLGSLTLVVNDVLSLDPKHQTLIYQFLISENKENAPLFIFGSTSEIENLQSQQIIHEGLAHLLIVNRLEVERLPRDRNLLNQTLEFMLEN